LTPQENRSPEDASRFDATTSFASGVPTLNNREGFCA
jgi:hypothetical protein